MATKRRTEIIIETERMVVVPASSTFRWCNACSGQVEMVAPEQAAVLVNITARTVYRWVEAQLLHFLEEPDGQVLICRNSLFGQVREGN